LKCSRDKYDTLRDLPGLKPWQHSFMHIRRSHYKRCS